MFFLIKSSGGPDSLPDTIPCFQHYLITSGKEIRLGLIGRFKELDFEKGNDGGLPLAADEAASSFLLLIYV